MTHVEPITPIVKLNTTMLNLSICNYSDAYILVEETITVIGDRDDAAARQADKRNIQITFKNCAPFTDCIREKNKQVDNTKDLHVVMPMYDLIEFSSNYLKTSGSLWEYFRDEPNATITDSG